MGRRKVYAGVSIPRIYEDIPDLDRQAIVQGIFSGRSITNSLLMSSLQGPVNASRQVNRYANSGDYHYGTLEVFASKDEPLSTDEVWIQFLRSIDTYIPSSGHISYFTVIDENSVVLNGTTRGNTILQTEFALQNNPIVAPDTYERTEIFVDHTEIYKLVESQEPVLDVNGDPVLDGNGDPTYQTMYTETLHLDVQHPILTSTEHWVRYEQWDQGPRPPQGDNGTMQPMPAPTLVGTYVYDYYEDSGAIPKLHITQVITTIADDAFPVVPIRLNGVDYKKDGTGLDHHEDIKRIMGYLNIKAEDIVESIKSNPDEDDIDDVYLGFALSIENNDDWAIAGLAETFSILHKGNPLTESQFNLDGIRQNMNFNSVELGGFNNVLTYNYTTSELKTGSPGYTKTFQAGNDIVEQFETGQYNDNGDPIYSSVVVGSTNQYTFTRPTEVDNQYEEIVISGFSSVHRVEVPGFGFKEVSFLDSEAEIMVPMFQSVVRKVPNRLRADLIFGSMVLFIYTYQIIKLKWYQTGIFKAFLIVVAVVLAVFTYGASIAAGFSVGVVAGLIAVGIALATSLIINYAVQWLVEEVGGTLALILAVIVGLYTGDFSTLTLELNTTFYSIFSSAVRVYGAYTNDKLNTITDQAAAFDREYEERLVELNAAQEALEYGVTFNLLGAVEYYSLPNTDINESPQEFYDRTSTIVDVAGMSAALVTNYHEAKLILPKVDSYLPTHKF